VVKLLDVSRDISERLPNRTATLTLLLALTLISWRSDTVVFPKFHSGRKLKVDSVPDSMVSTSDC